MSKKYIDVSLSSGLNDGTSLANAWQNFSEVMRGVQANGSVADGDTVYVRTADASGNLEEYYNIDVTFDGVGGTVDLPITVVFDDGTVWPQAGQFRFYTGDVTTNQVTINDFTIIEADGENHRFIIDLPYTGTSKASGLLLKGCVTDGIFLDNSAASNGGHTQVRFSGGGATGPSAVHSNFRFTCRNIYSAAYYGLGIGTGTYVRLINLIIDVSKKRSDFTNPIIHYAYQNGCYDIIGGRLIGGWDTLRLTALGSTQQYGTTFYVEDFDYTPAMEVNNDDINATKATGVYNYSFIGCGHKFNAFNIHGGVISRFKYGDNYPYLNSILPTGEPWSFKIYPSGTAPGTHGELPIVDHYYDQGAVSRTLTMEFLIDEDMIVDTISYTGASGTFHSGEVLTGNTSGAKAVIVSDLTGSISLKHVEGIFEVGETIADVTGVTATSSESIIGLHAGNLYSVFTYRDSITGSMKQMTTKDSGAVLSASSASWSNVTYGAKTYIKRKTSVTTPDPIQDKTMIRVRTFCAMRKKGVTDFFFYEPDVTVT